MDTANFTQAKSAWTALLPLDVAPVTASHRVDIAHGPGDLAVMLSHSSGDDGHTLVARWTEGEWNLSPDLPLAAASLSVSPDGVVCVGAGLTPDAWCLIDGDWRTLGVHPSFNGYVLVG